MSSQALTVAQTKRRFVKRLNLVGKGLAWCALFAGLSLLGWGLFGGHRLPMPAVTMRLSKATAAPVEPQVVVFSRIDQPEGPTHCVRRIETIRLGQRVLGRNPLRQQVEHGSEPEPGKWRQVRLELRKTNGRQLYVDLLRPLMWLEQHQAHVGGGLRLDLPEMGACGEAKVVAIDPCPEIEPGTGQIVTGRYRHEPDDNILDVRVAGQEEPIGVTDTHPFWSEDRREFVPVGKLRVSEHVRTATLGVVAITSIQHRPREAWVYNLEVQGEHVYQVGDAGVLVHNNNGTPHTISGSRPPNAGRTGPPNSIHEQVRADGSRSVTYFDAQGRRFARQDFGQLAPHGTLGQDATGRTVPHEHRWRFDGQGRFQGADYRQVDINGNPVGPWIPE